jgi:hypothetical protein
MNPTAAQHFHCDPVLVIDPENGNPSHTKTRRRKEIKHLLNNGASPTR